MGLTGALQHGATSLHLRARTSPAALAESGLCSGRTRNRSDVRSPCIFLFRPCFFHTTPRRRRRRQIDEKSTQNRTSRGTSGSLWGASGAPRTPEDPRKPPRTFESLRRNTDEKCTRPSDAEHSTLEGQGSPGAPEDAREPPKTPENLRRNTDEKCTRPSNAEFTEEVGGEGGKE